MFPFPLKKKKKGSSVTDFQQTARNMNRALGEDDRNNSVVVELLVGVKCPAAQ
jgi:hypothetical protein